MGNSKTLYCPWCYRKLGEWDGRSVMTKSIQCRKCNHMISFKNGKFLKSEAVPKRNTASGTMFR